MNLHKNFATLSHSNKQEKKLKLLCPKGTMKYKPLKKIAQKAQRNSSLYKSDNEIPAFSST
jgi:hypothetical protein